MTRHWRTSMAFAAAALAALAQSPPSDTFSILMSGNAAGKSIQTRRTDGAVEIHYSFNDRGRGPDVSGRYRFDSRGFPTLVELSGHDYYKAPVDERLTLKDGEARWKSTSEA